MRDTRLRPLPIAIGLALASACSVPPANSPGGHFSFEPETDAVIEGDVVAVTVRRSAAERAAIATWTFSGDAQAGQDFEIESDAHRADGTLVIEFPAGVSERAFTVRVVDDALTEASETIGLRGQAGFGLHIRASDVLVSNTDDDGPGSLRQAVRNANLLDDEGPIRFDSIDGPFGEVQAIRLASPLPQITGDVEINGYIPERLWRASGVIIHGGGNHRIFEVAPGGHLRLRYLSLVGGQADGGGAVRNDGNLLLSGVTLLRNEAARDGGAVLNRGDAQLINVTFAGNEAGRAGGAVANEARMVVTHATVANNAAPRASGLWSSGALRLANSILAYGEGGPDCVIEAGQWHPASDGNIITRHEGCGAPLEADPALDPLGYYNGPGQSFALGGGSPAVNLAVNELSVDEKGDPLVWDQRGNGDPRFVAGYADIGAFEKQAFPDFMVDTDEDNGLRGCMPSGPPDCPLRAAIELANVSTLQPTITFHPRVFGGAESLVVDAPLPMLSGTYSIHSGDHGPRRVVLADGSPALVIEPSANVTLIDIE